VKADLVSADEIGGSPVNPESTEPDTPKKPVTTGAAARSVDQRRAVFWVADTPVALFARDEEVGPWPRTST
jgi:hypothetical protein